MRSTVFQEIIKGCGEISCEGKLSEWDLKVAVVSLAKRIVEDYHQGKIFVKYSDVGKGTVFCIELPNTTKAKKFNINGLVKN